MTKGIEVYHFDDIELERKFGMDIKTCQRLGHFGNNMGVEYITLSPYQRFEPHHHVKSDALVIILQGLGHIIDDKGNRYSIRPGNVAYFPRGEENKHGFITSDRPMELISISSPPIKNPLTGEEDFVE